ncbi:MAG: Lpg1974 family pore-forming outer membrane protein [Parachlamydiales bacterium]
MKYLLKGLGFILTGCVSLFTTQLQGDYFDDTYPCCNNYVANDCALCDDFFGKATFSADLLYWTARQQGLDYDITTSSTLATVLGAEGLNVTQQADTTTHTSRYHFDWRLGYRFGLGYEFTADGWNLFLNWTHIPGKASGHREQTPGLLATGSWRLTFDSVDALLRSPLYCTNSGFNWSFLAGVRAARINQKIRARAPAFSFSPSQSPFFTTSVTISQSNSITTNNYRGVGPEIGVNLSWDLCSGFSLFGKANGTLLYSRARQKNYFSNSNAITTFAAAPFVQISNSTFSFKNSNHFWQIVSDFAVGISWLQTVDFFECDSEFEMRLAWEHSQWYGHLHTRGGTNDLGFDGVTLSAALSY